MNTAKSFGLNLNKSFLSILLFLLPMSFLFTFVFAKAEPVKKLVRDTGIYDAMSQTAVKTTVTTAQNSGQVKGVPEEAVYKAAQKAFPASDMQAKSESVIDSAYAWLEGKSAQFEPRISIENNTQTFFRVLGDEAVQIAERKPVCTYDQLVLLRADDPSTLIQSPCRPEVLDEQAIRDYFTSITSTASQQIGQANPSLSQFSQTGDDNSFTTKNPLNSGAPAVFGILKYSFYIMLPLVMLSLLIFFLLQRHIPDYLRLLVAPFLGSGVLLLLYSIVGWWIIGQNWLTGIVPGTQTELTQELLRPFAAIGFQVSMWFGGTYLLLGVIFYIAHRTLRQSRSSIDKTLTYQPVYPNEGKEVTSINKDSFYR